MNISLDLSSGEGIILSLLSPLHEEKLASVQGETNQKKKKRVPGRTTISSKTLAFPQALGMVFLPLKVQFLSK